MRIFKPVLAAALALFLGSATMAATVTLHGVKVEDHATVAGGALLLNGVGTRYRGPFKVYVGALYTTKKVSSLDELVAAPGPKRLSMTFLREIEAGPLGKLLTRGVEDNVPKSEISKLVPGLIRMGDIFTRYKLLVPGDVITFDWVPGTGVVISISLKGKPTEQEAPFNDPQFYKAVMSIWFGNSPADHMLKDDMLGTK